MNRSIRYQQIKKISSKIGQKGAKGMNFSHAQNQLSEANPGMEFSRDQITRKMSEEPLFSEEALDSVFKITIEDHHAKMMNKAEKAFIEIGAFLTKKEDHIQEIGDYLISERAEPGWLSRPNGNEPPRYNISLETLQGVMDEFNRLDEAQRNWHTEEAAKAAKIEEEEGLFGNGYMTNEVVYEFDDGWKVVYVPAVGEGPNYKGDNRKSNDRTIEGNLNGLCLGATMGYYQTNDQGKIYSVRDPGNNPKVTIRINNDYLAEAKGKNNLPPGVPGAIHAKKWLTTQNIYLRGYSGDYDKFPPTTREDAIKEFGDGRDEAYQRGWVMHWYRAGVPQIDIDVEKKIENNDILIIHSSLGKKYKELVQPVVKFWTDRWTQLDDGTIWSNFNISEVYQLSHESWKIYKKESWMKDAVEKLMKEEEEFGFKIGIHLIPDYKKYGEIGAKILAENEPLKFFEFKLDEAYLELGHNAAKTILEDDPSKFFTRDINKKFPELERDAAEKLSIANIRMFFELGVAAKYPEFIKDEQVRELSPVKFFSYASLNKDFPDIAREKIIESEKSWDGIGTPSGWGSYSELIELRQFFTHENSIHKDFPDIAKKWINKFALKNTNLYFGYKFHIQYPEAKKTAAEALIRLGHKDSYAKFLNYDLHKDFPDLMVKLAEKIIDSDPYLFFELRLNKRIKTIDLKSEIIKSLENAAINAAANEIGWIDKYGTLEDSRNLINWIYAAYPKVEAFKKLFIILKRSDMKSYYIFEFLNINPNAHEQQQLSNNTWLKENIELAYEEDPVFIYNLFKFFKNSDDNTLNSFIALLPEDFFKNIARIIAKEDPDLFFKDELDKHNVEAKNYALKEMSKIDFVKWINLSGYKTIYLNYMLRIADSSLENINLQLSKSGYLGNNDIDNSYFPEFKTELFSDYFSIFIYPNREVLLEIDIDPENFDQEYLLEDTVDKENIQGAVLGFVSWGIDNLVENIEEEEFINVKDILNRYIENFYVGSFSSAEFENAKKIGYNLRAQLEGYNIKRDMQRDLSSNIYEEEAEGIYQEEGVYNPMEEIFDNYDEVEEGEEEGVEEEDLDKLSKLYNYLIKSGFSKEAEILKEFRKIAVLKRLKRTTRGKGKRDRMEWALVSKSNPKKILKWFGPDKPSKKEIAKEERRVHAFG